MTALPQCTDEMLELFFTYNSLNVIMMTIPFFLIAKKVKVRSELIQRMLANLTVCGFVSTQFRASPFERALFSALNRVLLIN